MSARKLKEINVLQPLMGTHLFNVIAWARCHHSFILSFKYFYFATFYIVHSTKSENHAKYEVSISSDLKYLSVSIYLSIYLLNAYDVYIYLSKKSKGIKLIL